MARRCLRRGLTLVEVMVSLGIFALLASSLLAGFMATRRLSENNLAEAYANSTAQCMLEQIVSLSPTLLTSAAETSVEIKLPVLNASSYTTMPEFALPWADNDSTYTSISTSPKGLLADAVYIAGSQTIRGERYMPIEFNLRRIIPTDLTSVHILLRYRWQSPARRSWLTGELRTVRSTALRF